MRRAIRRSIVIISVIASIASWCWIANAAEQKQEKGSKAPAVANSRPPAKPDTATKSDADVIAEQMPTYPLDTCPVLGSKLGEHGNTVDYLYKGRLVRFCCKGCVAAFEKDPPKYLAILDAAAKTKEQNKPAAGEKGKAVQGSRAGDTQK